MAAIDDLFQAALGLAALPAQRATRAPARSTTPSPRPGGTWTCFQHQAWLHARVPGVTCPTHGTRQVALPWARPGSGFTLGFEALLVALLAQMPVKAVADLVSEHDTRLWRRLHHHVEQASAQLDLAEVTRIGVDETSAKGGQDDVLLFVDLDAPKPRVLFATEAATIGPSSGSPPTCKPTAVTPYESGT